MCSSICNECRYIEGLQGIKHMTINTYVNIILWTEIKPDTAKAVDQNKAFISSSLEIETVTLG